MAVTALLALGLVGFSGSQRATASGWYCYDTYSTGCVTQFGYTGQSVWGYPVDGWGNNCTNYAAFRLAQNGVANPGNLGDASSWAANARGKGLIVNQVPTVGSIAQWTGRDHVAYVDWVSADGTQIQVSESGYNGSWPSMSGRGTLNVNGPNTSRTNNDGAWPDNFIHFNGSGGSVSNGSYVNYAGNVYVIAGGAPIYVSTWDAFGGPQATTALNAAQFAALPQTPTDGTFLRGSQTGQIYRIAGGAPLYVSSWGAVGGAQPVTNVDQAALDNAGGGGLWNHLNATPSNGTYITGFGTGQVFTMAGGAPIYVGAWSAVGGGQPTTAVDQADIDNGGGGGVWKHVNMVPTNGTFIRGFGTGQIFVIVGGAPVYVSTWVTYGGAQGTVNVDQGAIESAGSAAPLNHLNFRPTTGSFIAAEPSGNVFEILGGHPKYVNTWAQVGGPQPTTVVGDAVVNSGGAADVANPLSHLLQAEANNFSAPTLRGAATVGRPVIADPGVWGPGTPAFAYTWYVNGTVAAGKTAPSFMPTPAMVGKRITFTVTATEPNFVAQSATATGQVVAPGILTSKVPTVKGTTRVGSTLTVLTGTWTRGTHLKYQWNVNGKAVSKATGVTFTLGTVERGKTVTVTVTGSLAGYRTAATTSKPTPKIR